MAQATRGPKGKFISTMKDAENAAKAARMRSRGMTYEAISAELGYADHSAARKAVARALAAVVTEPAIEVRKFQLMQLDELTERALEVLDRDHVMVSHGRVIKDDQDKPILDDGPTLAAIASLLRIQERLAKLLGLDAPTKHVVITDDALDAAIDELSEELDGEPAPEAPKAKGPSPT